MTVVSILITVMHALEERYGNGGPLWTYFGNIAGYWPSRKVGMFVTILMPAAMLSTLAWFAYGEHYDWAISLLFGARVGDLVVNHGFLLFASRPNPGIITAWMLYTAEAWLLYQKFGIENLPLGIVGVLLFAGIVPAFALVGIIKEKDHY